VKPLPYDPLESLAVHLAHPGKRNAGMEFFKDHKRYISARYGSTVAIYIQRIIEEADLDAARRVAAIICPNAYFSISVRNGSIFVDYTNMDLVCRENNNSGQSKSSAEFYSEATALLVAAINFHGTLVAEAEFSLSNPAYRA